MLRRARYFLSDLWFWIRSHPIGSLLVVVLVGAIAAGAVLLAGSLEDDETPPATEAGAPEVFVQTVGEEPEEADELGFPAFATRNTTRVAGVDPVADAAGIALATFPTGGIVEGPAAVTLVDSEDVTGGVAAASLVAAPVGAPILYARDGEIPGVTESALASLSPSGGPGTGGKEIFTVGDVPEPQGLKAERIEASTAADTAADIAALREKLTGEPPAHVLVASSDDPELAMPAAAWAARSGDPVLYAQSDSVPKVTLEAIEGLEDVPVYILGGEGVISEKAEKELEQAASGPVKRASESDDPVASAIEFARYVDGSFGWNINDPGHGFVIVNADRPADAAAAAPLSGTGTWGPMLLTDDPASAPQDLEGYLLDLKPGYEDDPTRALYNHIWIVGDAEAISVDFQVELDAIAEVARVRSGSGDEILGPKIEPESDEPPVNPKKDDEKDEQP